MVKARNDVFASDVGNKREDLRDVCGTKGQGLVIKYGGGGAKANICNLEIQGPQACETGEIDFNNMFYLTKYI